MILQAYINAQLINALSEKYEKAKRQLELHIQNIIKGDNDNGKY